MSNGRLSRKDLIREISKETFVRVEIVEVVLDSLTDIAVETLMKGDTFSLKNLFTMEIVEEKESTIMTTLSGKRIRRKPGRKLRTKTSPQLRKLVKLQHNVLKNKPLIVNRRTWKDALKWLLAGYASDYDNTYEVLSENFFAEEMRKKKGSPATNTGSKPQNQPETRRTPQTGQGLQGGKRSAEDAKEGNLDDFGKKPSGVPRRPLGGLPTNIKR